MPVRMVDSYYREIQKELEEYFYEFFWKDIMEGLGEQRVFNSSFPLIEAIRSGKIQYRNGEFRGTFTARISRELSRFAKYDGRRNVWTGLAPSDVMAAATVANDQARKAVDSLSQKIGAIPDRVEMEVGNTSFSIGTPLEKMSAAAERDLSSLGLSIQMTQELSSKLIEEYNANMQLNIKNWTGDQVERLRGVVEKASLEGYNRKELEELIRSEYGTTMNKARFLSRQETSLFVTTVRDERYKEAGVKFVKWSSSQDARVVGNPGGKYPDPSKGHGDHFKLNGKICRLDDPSVYADTLEDARAGKWKSKSLIPAEYEHAGKAFGCRCTYIPQPS